MLGGATVDGHICRQQYGAAVMLRGQQKQYGGISRQLSARRWNRDARDAETHPLGKVVF